MIYTSPANPYPYYGMAAYRIEFDLTLPVCPLQRHIWTLEDGSERADEWIRSIRETPEKLLARGWIARLP